MAYEHTEITLERTGRRPLTFRGREVWRWKTAPDRADHDYSGDPGRWTVLVLYQTDAGRFVLHEQRLTIWTGEHDRLDTHVFQTLPAIADWLEANCPGAAPAFCDQFGIAERLE